MNKREAIKLMFDGYALRAFKDSTCYYWFDGEAYRNRYFSIVDIDTLPDFGWTLWSKTNKATKTTKEGEDNE